MFQIVRNIIKILVLYEYFVVDKLLTCDIFRFYIYILNDC